MNDDRKPKAPGVRPGGGYAKPGTPGDDALEEKAARRAPAAAPKPLNIDLESPIAPGYGADRENNEIAKLDPVAPDREIGKYAAKTLNEAVDAATIVTNNVVPDGWTTVDHPELGKDFAATGAMHLVSPNGTEFLAFPDMKATRGEKIKQAFGLSSKAEAAARIGQAFSQDHDVTFAGHGRGGALAKLSAESASTWLGKSGDSVRPKTCVAINSTAVPPLTYKALDLASKNHARTTINIVNEQDAASRLKGFRDPVSRTDNNGYTVKQRGIYDGKIVGGPRSGERRGGDTVGNYAEPKAFPDTVIRVEGAIHFAETSGHARGPLQQLDGDIKHDLARKQLLGASKLRDAGRQPVPSRGRT